MPLIFNLRHLDEKNVHLKGAIPAEELDVEGLDELVKLQKPVTYDLEIQKLEQAVLAQGTLSLTLDCECARCLKPYKHPLKLEGWACHMPLEGEEMVVVTNDCVDLTPYIREDIVLAFPQHPLCRPDCSGLAGIQKKTEKSPGTAAKADPAAAAWAELDKLKL
jgi:uncharacterized metal-binding protein YceD (DUF177 family)